MKYLLDTHILLWAAGMPDRLTAKVRKILRDPANALVFSAASIWEVAIRQGLGREDFRVDAHLLRRGLLDNGYQELHVSSAHAAAVSTLPPVHKDPFDRMLVAQASAEGMTLLTADALVAQYLARSFACSQTFMSQRFVPIIDQRVTALASVAQAPLVAPTGSLLDRLGRPLTDLRISVTDRCNFRCSYCMPKEVFDKDYPYLPHKLHC